MRSKDGWFEIDGNDMSYFVVWDLYGEDLTINVYLDQTCRAEVTDYLFDTELQKIYDVAEEESLEGERP
jgi:hypothetical protein